MFVLDSVAVADTFPSDGASGGAQLVAQNGSNGGFAAVAGADVYVQLGYFSNGMLTWTPAVRASVGNIILAAGTRGIRFRNAVAGSVATVSAALSEPAEPPMQLAAGGVATPSTGNTVITGRVTAAGAIAGGTGFAVAKGGAGLYTITFTTAFASIPVINITTEGVAANPTDAQYTAAATTGFQAVLFNAGAGFFDGNFNFTATETV